MDVPGVTRSWIYPREQGEGAIIVRFVMDDGYPNGIPLPEDGESLLAHLESKQLVTAAAFGCEVHLPQLLKLGGPGAPGAVASLARCRHLSGAMTIVTTRAPKRRRLSTANCDGSQAGAPHRDQAEFINAEITAFLADSGSARGA